MENFTAQQPMPTTEMLPDGPSKRFAIVLTRALARIWARIARMPFNNSETVSASDTGTADTEFSIIHHLGRAPQGFLVLNIDKGGVVYDSGTTWTDTKIYLKCSAANAAVSLRVF